MANKLFNYFFIKKENKANCLTIYGKQREVKYIRDDKNNEKAFLHEEKELKVYFENSISLAPIEYYPNRAFLRN